MKRIPIRPLKLPKQDLPSSERFTMRRVENILNGTDLRHDLHRHSFYFILALKKGKGNHEIDFINFKVADNSFFFLRPGQVHQLELKAGCTGYLIEFNNEFYHPNDNSAAQRFRKVLHKIYCKPEIERFDRLYAILNTMFREYTDREEGFNDIIKSNLDIFFIEFLRQSKNSIEENKNTNSYTQERFEEFLALLDLHIANNKQVSHYTGLMNLSSYQLNEITKSSIGKTASELITEHILLEAKRYLLATPNQVKEIADQLGYEDSSYFIRFFKKHTGQSPEAFRHNFK